MGLGAQNRRAAVRAATEITCVAASWSALYWLNGWLFSSFAAAAYVSWVFLPAAVRVLAVMVADWRGVCGLFIGSLMTAPQLDSQLQLSVVLSGVSALAPYISLRVARIIFKLDVLLNNITSGQVIGISVLAAFWSSSLHSCIFALAGDPAGFWHSFIQMFVGDMLGTAIVLAVVSSTLKASRSTTAD